MKVRRGLLAALAAVAVVACTPTPQPTGPQAPKVRSFTAVGAPFQAPTMVPLAWVVSDANGDDLTCGIDADDDGVWDLTIAHCDRVGGVGSRLVEGFEGGNTARFEVTDGTYTTSTSTVFVVDAELGSESFDIALRPLAPVDPPVQAAFDAAAARWSAAIVRGIPDQVVTVDPGQCLADEPGATLSVDDLVITVEIVPIDGSGGVLGQAGPCVISATDNLTRAGIMQFDSADVADMIAAGTFDAVVLHEMGHVLGIGTLWDWNRSLLSGAGGSDPRFVGGRGNAEFSALGGASTSVLVENGGGPGTEDAHWREATFGNELMTGWISPVSNPLSAMTISSLGDLGYSVDRSVADSYSLPGLPAAMDASRPAAGSVDTNRMGRPPITVE